MAEEVDNKLKCKKCGTIYMDIPKGAGEDTPIKCSICGTYIGLWGELQDDFQRQIANTEALELKRGKIIKRKNPPR